MTTSPVQATASFTSAGQFPAKLLALVPSLRAGIHPLHLQLNLTNQCQLSCPYCSCAARDREKVLDYDTFREIIPPLKWKGLRAVTITGGGEPLLHQQFQEIVSLLTGIGLSIALLTNGLELMKYHPNLLRSLKWIRISYDANRKAIPEVWKDLKNVAWSYVYSEGAENTKDMRELIRRAESGEATHIRVVSNIRNPNAAPIPSLSSCPNVIVQNRSSTHTHGSKECWISLLKPYIDCDGLVYPCCGVQYAIQGTSPRVPKQMSMGDINQYISNHVTPQRPFDGSICDVCYYDAYNKLLSSILSLDHTDHMEFV